MIARDALGLGLRIPHYSYLFEHWPPVDYFEIISENFFGDALPPRRHLDLVRERYPLVLHGVGLNLLGEGAPEPSYLDRVARLADYVDAPFVTDHLCWTGSGGLNHHDLLPTPYVDDLVGMAAERAARVQAHLGRPFGLENLSSYVTFRSSTLSEWDFYSAVVRTSGCHYMLDVNNIYVSSQNHEFSCSDYLSAIDFSRVLQVHIAGHTRTPQGNIIDTHDHPVAPEVWALYREAWERGGPFPTLLEWDDHIPEMPVVLAELERARTVRA
jgi:uncharacterized protein (UPF0276 family)